MGAVKPAERGRFEVVHIRVQATRRRRGYGRLMMNELEWRASELGARELFLSTTVQQVPAQRLYESVGYECSHDSLVQAEDGSSYQLVHYSKKLWPR